MMKSLAIIISCLSLWYSIHAQDEPLLLVVAFDGFRWDYVNEHRTPHLWQVVTDGVWATQGVRNQFPTITLPNMYSIVTGLYEENHGLIGNIMHDPDLKEDFDYWQVGNRALFDSSRDWKWYSGIPIWQANENGGKNRRSGAMRFPLCDSRINNKTLFKCEPVKLIETSKNWIDEAETDLNTIIKWFLDPNTPINLGLIYIGQPDAVQHDNDIYSDKVSTVMDGVDYIVDILNRKLSSNNLRDKMNVMYVSDHGHVNVFKEWNTIEFDPEISSQKYKWSGQSIFPNSNISVDSLFKEIKRFQHSHPKFNAWLKGDVPEYLHYKNNKRIGPIVITEHLGYSIVSHGETAKYLPQVRGLHGYLNDYHEMWPMFVASGPSFKKNYRIEANLETVDYFSIMCEILQINCPKNDGNFKRAHSILSSISAKGKKWLETNEATTRRKLSVCFQTLLALLLIFLGSISIVL